MGNTKVDLVRDLGERPKSRRRDALIALAQVGYYHDFESDVATPKIQCVIDLTKAGFNDLATKVRHGEYDEPPPKPNAKRKLARKKRR